MYVYNSPLRTSDPSGLAPLCSSQLCTTDMIIKGEGIYGLYAEVSANKGQRCLARGSSCGSINFTYLETHEPPAKGWPFPERVGDDGCLRPANEEIGRHAPHSWRYGNIKKRGCTPPVVASRRSKKGCWTIRITWTCPITCRDNGALRPTSPWLGIYSRNWGESGPRAELPGAILL